MNFWREAAVFAALYHHLRVVRDFCEDVLHITAIYAIIQLTFSLSSMMLRSVT